MSLLAADMPAWSRLYSLHSLLAERLPDNPYGQGNALCDRPCYDRNTIPPNYQKEYGSIEDHVNRES
jgi:hypothetical protein